MALPGLEECLACSQLYRCELNGKLSSDALFYCYIQLHSWSKSMLYLGSFVFTSTLFMGIFAAVYGEVTHRVSNTDLMLYR
jgi:hypothetical protein